MTLRCNGFGADAQANLVFLGQTAALVRISLAGVTCQGFLLGSQRGFLGSYLSAPPAASLLQGMHLFCQAASFLLHAHLITAWFCDKTGEPSNHLPLCTDAAVMRHIEGK